MRNQLTAWLCVLSIFLALSCTNDPKAKKLSFSNSLSEISINSSSTVLWEYNVKSSGKTISFAGPRFEIDGAELSPNLKDITKVGEPLKLKNGVIEYVFEGTYPDKPDLKLRMYFRLPDANPVVRFKYELVTDHLHTLTKSHDNDNITYFATSFDNLSKVKEIRFSEFNEMVHSFCLSERNIETKHFNNKEKLMGPILSGSSEDHSFLVAYEHGSQVPDAFVEYSLSADKKAELKAVKGNYYRGQTLNKNLSFTTIWFEAAAIQGNEDQLAATYREFVLKYMTENLESRKPYIFYNTWNFQERNRNWYKKPYLADMNEERMLKEIETAHQMGIDVFVIDAGWFEKTGDWAPSKIRFPDQLKTIKERLTKYGMKLGLWFDPNAAAVSSKILAKNRDCVKTLNGKEDQPHKIWETEESYRMCLVSKYRDDFANELIRCAKEYGVTYFKWDAIGQYGCNDPRHFHGNENNTAEERAECFAFEVGRSMAYVVDKLCAAIPEAIVDFDITEGNRSVGLGFLAAGKYFLINNGPYYFNYDIPFDRVNGQWNIFFFPGPARTWICRTPLTYDKWFPSVLFLTHYLPDDPYENQSIALGSLILGQNGIWGDLPAISKEGIAFFGKTLTEYKQIRDDITEATLIRDGAVGGSPEVYEKINPATGKGAVVVFSSHGGSYSYITKATPSQNSWQTDGVNMSFDNEGHAVIHTQFSKAEAKIILFGIAKN
jgi:alpha-galactosidase